MFEILMRLTKHFLVKFLQLPVSLWIDIQWANLRYRETCHLLRLDAYLLRDMGLKKVDGRIEALDSSRIDPDKPLPRKTSTCRSCSDRVRHAN